jgi:hypothetical protein
MMMLMMLMMLMLMMLMMWWRWRWSRRSLSADRCERRALASGAARWRRGGFGTLTAGEPNGGRLAQLTTHALRSTDHQHTPRCAARERRGVAERGAAARVGAEAGRGTAARPPHPGHAARSVHHRAAPEIGR